MQAKAFDALSAPIVLGRIGAPFGLEGLVKVYSFTSPQKNILRYASWTLIKQNRTFEICVQKGRVHGDCLVVALEGISNRDEAAALCHSKIAVAREKLAPLKEDVFYWADLENLQVQTVQGDLLGKVDYLYENAGTDILVVKSDKKECHIPFLMHDTIVEVDLAAKKIIVDWDFVL
jgi:16S rRNA processing protein RimM